MSYNLASTSARGPAPRQDPPRPGAPLPGRVRVYTAALLVVAVLIALGGGVLASVTFTEHDLDGAWNVITLSPHGFGFGDAELEDGEHEGGSDHILKTASGETDTGAIGVFAQFFKDYELFSDGWFFGEAGHEGEDEHSDEEELLAYGILSRTGAAAAFFGINTAEEEEAAGHGAGLGLRGLEEEDEHHEISTYFAAVKRNGLDTPAMLGAPSVSRFVGAYLAIGQGETTARHGLLAFRRSFDSGLHLLDYDPGSTTLTQRAGTLAETSGAGGVAIASANVTASVRSGIAAGSFTDTAAIYRFAFDAETTLALIVRDTAPTAALRNFAGAAVRPRSPLSVSDISGIWQLALLLPEDDAFHGSFATLDLVGDGTGDYDNGEEDEFYAGPVSWSIGTQTLGGAIGGESVAIVEFKPAEDEETVTIHFFVSVDSRYLVGAGITDGFFGMGAKRPNAVVADLAFDVEKEVLDQDSTEVFLKVQPGATAGAPRMHFSLMGSQNRLMKGFSRLRDSDLAGAGITRLLSAITVTPETRVLNPESIVMTINLKNLSTGGASGAGVRGLAARALGAVGLAGDHDGHNHGGASASGDAGPGSRLVPLVFNETKKQWELVPEANVVSRTETSITFRPPHFSSLGVASVAGKPNPEVKVCAITALVGTGPAAGALPHLRTLREALLFGVLGRHLVAAYHAWGMPLLALLALIATGGVGFLAKATNAGRTTALALCCAVCLAAAPAAAQAPEPEESGAAATGTEERAATPAGTPSRATGVQDNRPAPRSQLLPDIGLTLDGVIEKRERAADFANIRSAELMVGSSVDPYFDLYANVLMTPEEILLEEAYATVHFSALVPSIPIIGALQGRFGRMLLPFGHLGGIHPHAFPQVDAPLAVREFFGGESPNQIGGWLEYVVPWYDNPSVTLLAGAFNGDYGRAFDGTRGHGPLWLGRVTTFTEWGGGRNALRVSGSLLDDRNDTTSGLHSRIWSLEGKYRYAFSERGRQVLVGAEYLRHERDENARTLNKVNGGRDLATEGAYAWGQYDHNTRWGVGYRYDRTHPLLTARNRYDAHSPYLEYRPSEFSKLRLQWRREDPVYGEKETRIMLQGVWSIGWHPAHKF